MPATALAFDTPAHLAERPTIEVAAGASARLQPRVSWTAPLSSRAAWQRFQAQHGKWSAYFDLDRKVPGRIYGEGIALSGDAVKQTEALLAEHLDLLAPGARMADFELVSDVTGQDGVRSLGFIQRYQGAEVLGGQISVRIKNDRIIAFGSEAFPDLDALISDTASAKTIEQSALRWIQNDFPTASVSIREGIAGPYLLPLIRTDGTISQHGVFEVVVDARDPVGRWSVYVDGATGAPVARQQRLFFAAGSLQYNAPERRPGATRIDYPARFVNLSAGGQTIAVDDQGMFTWAGTDPITVEVGVSGTETFVINEGGPQATASFTVEDGGTAVWNRSSDELEDAQLITYVHGNFAKDRAKLIAPDMGWLFTDRLEAHVNYNDSCNAFSDGTTINFFRESNRCNNTGRLADVVHHEFGHSFHAHAVIRGVGRFDGALSEGGSDYFAATISNDAGMGRGFFKSNRPLRNIDQAQGEATWPDDVGQDTHQTGIIFGGTLWDLRKALILIHGEQTGVEITDNFLYASFQRATDIPSTYIETLTADDDDGDLSNGTPNKCAIDAAFAAHGLADPSQVGPPLGLPELTGLSVKLPLGSREQVCPGDDVTDATLEWRLRSDNSIGGLITLAGAADGFEGEIPAQAPGTVVEYRVNVTTENGSVFPFPKNRAAPFYEVFVGEVVELFCSDFETEASQIDFSHELLAGENREGADDWQWGIPAGTPGSGDPSQAFSGERVYGNDLGGGNFNGRYQPNRQNVLHAPAIHVQGFENVRLHYRRWLNVEDAFFDQADILSNGQTVWTNLNTGDGGNTHHEDQEWRFHDVDLSSTIVNDAVQVDFRITSDGGLEFGGWTIDNFCIVGYQASEARCGDGKVDVGEACDDGNLLGGDGCEADCTLSQGTGSCGDGVVDPGEACDDGNAVDGDGCETSCVLSPTITDPACAEGDPACNPGLTTLEDDNGGCGCSAAERSEGTLLGVLLLAGLFFFRRRR